VLVKLEPFLYHLYMKKADIKITIILIIIIFQGLLFSCTAEKAKNMNSEVIQTDPSAIIETETSEVETTESTAVKEDPFDFKVDDNLMMEGILTISGTVADPAKAHAGYLNDPMDFFDLPELPEWEKSSVVGSDLCLFYPLEGPYDNLDQTILPEGLSIPLGTVIPIIEKISASNQEYYGMFLFQENYNWFYKTEWQGQSGLVFGADLNGLKDSLEENLITSVLYKTDAVFNKFPPFRGYRLLGENVKDRLIRDRLAFQEVSKDEYNLHLHAPDDIIALYKNEARDKYQPVFITTDLFAHSMHLFFNNYLQQIEEDVFFTRLEGLVKYYLELLEDEDTAAVGNGLGEDHNYRKAIKSAKDYFLVADALISMAPRKESEKEQYGNRVKILYVESDKDAILSKFPESIQAELALIEDAAGFQISPNFDYEEDYSQYKPRGHYTKNGILEAYFKSIMWFGRLHCYISPGNLPVLFPEGAEDDQQTAFKLAKKMAPVAILISDLSKRNETVYNNWKSLFDPITELIGMSDDLSISDLIPFNERFDISNLPEWMDNEENIELYIKEASENLRPPLISGNSVLKAPAEESTDNVMGASQPMGWRLFGQRFTYDSYIHQQLSAPRFFPRDFVTGLDIMTVFGSNFARKLFEVSEYANPEMAGLKELHENLRANYEEMSPQIWEQTYYNRVLYQIKSQAQFEPGTGFYFTESPAWGIKVMLSSHGTWAALRHDTILYVKQVYAERAGDGDLEPTFRIKEVPKPIHYLEPNYNFFRGSYNAILHLQYIMDKYHITDEVFEQRIASWKTMLEKAITISEAEYADQPLDRKDIEWIRTVPEQLAHLVLPRDAGFSTYTEDPDSLRGAVIADIFTNADFGEVLEVGTGIPHRIYVPLNDGQGGKRIAVGYTFSYYEFRQPMTDRLTDEQWKELVYSDDPDMTPYAPFWAREISLLPLE
jgi:Protein of unknown function (DUF3160)